MRGLWTTAWVGAACALMPAMAQAQAVEAGNGQVIQVPGFADFLAVEGKTVWATNRGRVEHWSKEGKLAQVAGVLVGDVAGVDSAALERLLKQTFEPLRIPVLSGWRSGHCDPNLTLPMGALVRLDAGEQRLVLEQDVVLKP